LYDERQRRVRLVKRDIVLSTSRARADSPDLPDKVRRDSLSQRNATTRPIFALHGSRFGRLRSSIRMRALPRPVAVMSVSVSAGATV
jgi:hypothetical protein